MRKTTSFRLPSSIKEEISRSGGGTYIEGCILLCTLSSLRAIAQRLALEYEQKGFPPLSSIELTDTVCVRYSRTEQLLQERKEEEPLDLHSLISSLEDIPDDIPESQKRAIASLLKALGEREDLNI